MTVFFAIGSADTILDSADLKLALHDVYARFGARQRVLAVPPDFTRLHSRAGELTCLTNEYFGDALVDVLPALGTHVPMSPEQIHLMYPGIPLSKFREHRWRDDVVTIGEVPKEFVVDVTEGIWQQSWPVQMNKLLWEGGHDLIVSIGQVVPHEVIGMANYNKNIFIGTGGSEGINESHFIGASYGMERMMGVADTPLRKILNQAEKTFCEDLPLLYVLTVIGSDEAGELVTRGLFIGDDPECFTLAAELAAKVNITYVDTPLHKVVVYLDPDEFHSTWLGNKSIYRTRMAIEDDGELIVLAPGVERFGEDEQIDRLIRQFGYRTTPEIMASLQSSPELQSNLSAAAHLIHGSSENRFRVTYCPGNLSRAEIESVGYEFGELGDLLQRYFSDDLQDGWQTTSDGERYYFIRNPALGLWSTKK